ncbi:MAG: glycosyltransferase family 2 protein [Chthoniobacterales bacterium]
MSLPEFAIIIPACNEAACIGPVLDEFLATVDPEKFVIAVGVNGTNDETAQVARQRPVLVAETARRGYGHGCQAAIDLTNNLFPALRAYIFCAGDGATDPRDLASLTTAFEEGYDFVVGSRTQRLRNWRTMTLRHLIANAALGLWCGVLCGRPYSDLGPLRLISRRLFEKIAPQEMTFGWTIEAQVAAARLGAAIFEIPVNERRRIAGEQKVSGVTWRRTLSVGCQIVAAGERTRRHYRPAPAPRKPVFARPNSRRRREA